MNNKVLQSILAMFRARGYPEVPAELAPLPQWTEIEYLATPTVVVLVSPGSLKKTVAKRMIECMEESFQTRQSRLVVGNGGSRQAIACLQEAGIEFVPLSLLSFDRSVHSLVPSYRILSPPEKVALLHTYSTCELDWPKIFLSDPQVVYTGARLGDILHNISDNIFRVVIAAPV